MAGSVVQSGNESCGEKPMSAPGTPTATPWRSRRPLLLLALLGLVLAGLLAGQARPAAAGNKPTPASGPPYLADATDPAVTTLAADRQARLELLPGMGHTPWLEDAATVRQAVRRFIENIATTAPS
jgi:pimeloyl-ACP methyl ester carboxylesterase